jgi:hypothetical protein
MKFDGWNDAISFKDFMLVIVGEIDIGINEKKIS